MNKLSRRQFIVAGSLGCAIATARAETRTAASEGQETRLAHDVGRKFNSDGTVRNFAGNTFIGHIEQQTDLFDALLDIYRECLRYGFAGKIALTPPSSYHVTVFGGLNAEDQGSARWPARQAGAGIAAVTQDWLQQLRRRKPLGDAGFEFEFGTPVLTNDGAPHIPLHPANDATAQRLKAVRDDLSTLTGIRDKDHDVYQYHMTFGYLHHVLTEAESQSLLEATQHWIAGASARSRRLRIPGTQFCSFRDMYAFRILHQL